MILCLDVGNSQIFGGIFKNNQCVFRFRKSAVSKGSSDEIGIFLRSVLRENNYDPAEIDDVAICTVVPDLTHSLRNACLKYFEKEPFFLQAGVKTGLKIKTKNPSEVGADRIANSIAATHRYPGQNVIVVDYGTATTFDAVSADREYHGGVIVPGLKISMEALESQTAKLPIVEIVKLDTAVGRGTVESIQSGLYFGNIGIAKELIARITAELFPKAPPVVLVTGGIARLFEDCGLFAEFIPDLVLDGLFQAFQMNS